MTDAPWDGDAVSLVDAFRSGERSPLDELDATLAAIEQSELNAFSFLDPEPARKAAANADVTQPFGGLPVGVKELDHVAGWPATEGSIALKDEIATHDSTKVARLRAAGAIPIGLTTSSEFGGINLTFTKLNGATKNPWNPTHPVGRRAARPRRWPADSSRSRPAATAAVRSASRPASPGCPA